MHVANKIKTTPNKGEKSSSQYALRTISCKISPNMKSLLTLTRNINNFYFGEFLTNTCLPFICQNCQVGLISSSVLAHLINYPDVFTITKETVTLSHTLTNVQERNDALQQVLLDLRAKDSFVALRGWRSECYEIKQQFSSPVLFKMERSATPLFGVRQYGVHINGYVRHSTMGLAIWLQRRASTKQTWPGVLDSFVGGGLAEGVGVLETAVKEAGEEANVPEDLAGRMKPAGSVSFFHQSERGIHPNTEFVFDLEVPETFQPSNNDGEVDDWMLVPVDQVVDIITSQDFKITSAAVALDWLIRQGLVTVDKEPDLPEVVELLHLPLHNLYRKEVVEGGVL
eukprot:GFUD01022315.1.p1 GENE.GFUD01022315.1~~GFUD01022315.1.p1  ORF type:complete len:341 (+),score=120.96 GFUD01022315.1:46-1068(+)